MRRVHSLHILHRTSSFRLRLVKRDSQPAPLPFNSPFSKNTNSYSIEFNLPESTRLFAVIGMLRRDKGQDIFIEVARQYLEQDPNAVFLIVGDSTKTDTTGFKDELFAAIKRCNLENRVILTGYRSDIPRITKALDALLICSTGTEAQSRTAPQAFASKIPLVASKVGGVPELVTHDKTGQLVEIGDVDAYTEALLKITNEPDSAKQLTDQAYAFAKEELTFKHRMFQTLEVYNIHTQSITERFTI